MYVCMYVQVCSIIYTHNIYIYKDFIKLAYTEIVTAITVIVALHTWEEGNLTEAWSLSLDPSVDRAFLQMMASYWRDWDLASCSVNKTRCFRVPVWQQNPWSLVSDGSLGVLDLISVKESATGGTGQISKTRAKTKPEEGGESLSCAVSFFIWTAPRRCYALLGCPLPHQLRQSG